MQITKQTVSGIDVYTVQGQLDAITSPHLETELLAGVQAGAKQFIVDLEHVGLISSAALRVLLSMGKRMRRQQGKILLCAPSAEVKKVFEISDLSSLFDIYPTQAAALAAAGSGSGNESPAPAAVTPAPVPVPAPPPTPAAAVPASSLLNPPTELEVKFERLPAVARAIPPAKPAELPKVPPAAPPADEGDITLIASGLRKPPPAAAPLATASFPAPPPIVPLPVEIKPPPPPPAPAHKPMASPAPPPPAARFPEVLPVSPPLPAVAAPAPMPMPMAPPPIPAAAPPPPSKFAAPPPSKPAPFTARPAPPPPPPAAAPPASPVPVAAAASSVRNPSPLILVGILAVLGLGLVAGAAYLWRSMTRPKPPPTIGLATPGPSPVPGPTADVSTPTPRTSAPPTATTGTPGGEEPTQVTAPAKLNFDPADRENQEVRASVLQRIELMPITQKTKDQLYAAVERARRMGKVITITFGPGRSELTGADVEKLRQAIQQPEVQSLVNDPTMVFVVLGFADAKGNEQSNRQISERRAQKTLDALRGPCGLLNVMHSMGMGSSDVLGKQNLERNRAVEVWAVLP